MEISSGSIGSLYMIKSKQCLFLPFISLSFSLHHSPSPPLSLNSHFSNLFSSSFIFLFRSHQLIILSSLSHSSNSTFLSLPFLISRLPMSSNLQKKNKQQKNKQLLLTDESTTSICNSTSSSTSLTFSIPSFSTIQQTNIYITV